MQFVIIAIVALLVLTVVALRLWRWSDERALDAVWEQLEATRRTCRQLSSYRWSTTCLRRCDDSSCMQSGLERRSVRWPVSTCTAR